MGETSSVSHARYDPILVLSGDGSLGATQVGALRAIYRAGFRPAAIVGTSIGAINGAFLALQDEPQFELLKQAWVARRPGDLQSQSVPARPEFSYAAWLPV